MVIFAEPHVIKVVSMRKHWVMKDYSSVEIKLRPFWASLLDTTCIWMSWVQV